MFRHKVLLGIAAGVFTLAISGAPASASVLDFSQFGVMGGDVVDLGGGHVTGTGIMINQFAWFDMPIGTGSMAVNWFLDFDSDAGLRIYNGAGDDLLTGTFSSTSFTGGPLGMFGGSGQNTISAALAAFLMVDPGTTFDFAGFVVGLQQDGSNHYTAFSTDIGSTPAVPEPGSMTLLGLGLIGAARGLRRKFSAAA